MEDKSKKLEKIEKSVNQTNQVDVAEAKVIIVEKKLKKEEKKEACKREDSGVIKPTITGIEEK